MPSKYQEIKEYGSNMSFVQCYASEVFVKEQYYFFYVTVFEQTGNMSVMIILPNFQGEPNKDEDWHCYIPLQWKLDFWFWKSIILANIIKLLNRHSDISILEEKYFFVNAFYLLSFKSFSDSTM